MRWRDTLVLVTLALAVAAALVWGGRRVVASMHREQCAIGLRMIDGSIREYAAANDGALPSLAALAGDEDLLPGVFCCPADNAAKPASSRDALARDGGSAAHTSYVYVGDRLRLADLNGNVAVAIERPGRHGAATHVLLGDGRVESLAPDGPDAPWRRRVDEQVAAGVRPVRIDATPSELDATPSELDAADRARCGDTLRALGQALQVYAAENRGRYPPDAANLARCRAATPELLRCPATATPYEYVGRWAKTADVPADEVMAIEPAPNHGGDGAHALRADGRVEWFDAARLDAIRERHRVGAVR